MIYLGRTVIFHHVFPIRWDKICRNSLYFRAMQLADFAKKTIEFFCNENTRIWECTDMYDI